MSAPRSSSSVTTSADPRMTASAVDVVNERWLLIEEGAHARELAGFGGVMDRMILGRGRRHEPSRRINHVRGIIPTIFNEAAASFGGAALAGLIAASAATARTSPPA